MAPVVRSGGGEQFLAMGGRRAVGHHPATRPPCLPHSAQHGLRWLMRSPTSAVSPMA
jgi:hypothetical protein